MTKTTDSSRRDLTIADIHKMRERISDAFGGNIRAITQDAQKRQELSGRRTVSYAKTSNQTTPSSDEPGDEPADESPSIE